MAFFRMPDSLSNLLCWLASSRGRPRLIHGDYDGGYRGSIHPGKGDEFAAAVSYRDHYRFLDLKRMVHDHVDRPLRLRIVNSWNRSHDAEAYQR